MSQTHLISSIISFPKTERSYGEKTGKPIYFVRNPPVLPGKGPTVEEVGVKPFTFPFFFLSLEWYGKEPRVQGIDQIQKRGGESQKDTNKGLATGTKNQRESPLETLSCR